LPGSDLDEQEAALLDSYEYSLRRVDKQGNIGDVYQDLAEVIGAEMGLIERYFGYMQTGEDGQKRERAWETAQPVVKRREGGLTVCFDMGKLIRNEVERRLSTIEEIAKSPEGNDTADNSLQKAQLVPQKSIETDKTGPICEQLEANCAELGKFMVVQVTDWQGKAYAVQVENNIDWVTLPTDWTFIPTNELKAPALEPLPPIQCTCSSACTQSCPCSASSSPLFLPNSPNKVLSKAPAVLVKGCKDCCSCSKDICAYSFIENSSPQLAVIRRAAGSSPPFWSLASLQDIHQGEFVLEVTGEVIDPKDRRNALLTVPICPELCLSMISRGGLGRFLQHSCDPSLTIVRFCPSADLRRTQVLLFARKSISKAQDLSVDFDSFLCIRGRIPCLCGSAVCRGHIGVE